MAKSLSDFSGNSKLPWSWEGNVQAQVARHLICRGWAIEQMADTASRQGGIDLVASKEGRRLAIEVKGFPGTVYARGAKAGQPKPTSPTLQAKHWLAQAFLTAVLLRGTNDPPEIGLAFPDVKRYRDLLGKLAYGLHRLDIRVFLADERGHVTELGPNDRLSS